MANPRTVTVDGVTYTLQWISEARADSEARAHGEDACFTPHRLRASVQADASLAAEMELFAYLPSRDPHPFLTWDNSSYGSLDSLAVFNPRAAMGEGRSTYTLADLGYARRPGKVLVLSKIKYSPGRAQSALGAVMMRHAILEHAQTDTVLVLAEFSGGAFADSGYPTPRGWTEQLGFYSASSRVMALPNEQRRRLADPGQPYPKFTRRPPEPTKEQILAGPTFDGRIFQRAGNVKPQIQVHELRLVCNEQIADEDAVRMALLAGLQAGDLELREGDRRGDPAFSASQPVPARLVMGNQSFEVPLHLTEHQLRHHPRKTRHRLTEDERNWLAFLLSVGDVLSALTAYWRVSTARYASDYQIASTRHFAGWTEIHDPTGPRSLVLMHGPEQITAVYCRVGTAPDGFRPIAVSANDNDALESNFWGRPTGGARYLDLKYGTDVERWTKQKAEAFRKATKNKAKKKLAKPPQRKVERVVRKKRPALVV